MHDDFGGDAIVFYLASLKKELTVFGLSNERILAVLSESKMHLIEAMEVAAPKTTLEAERVLEQFGDAKLLAKNLAREYANTQKPKRSLWPLAIVPLTMISIRIPYLYFELHGGHSFVSFLLVGAGVALFMFGIRGRRPMIVEFGVLAIALTIVQTVWLSATAYPVSHTSRRDMTYVEFVGRSNVVSQVEDWNKAIVSQRGISDTVSAGKLLFQKTNVRHVVPNKFMAGSRYLLPEGIREVGLGVSPKKMNPSLMVGTWSEAVSQWNADPSHSVGASADQILESTPDSISYLSLSIAHLNDIRNKPMLAQVGLTLPWISTVTFSSCAIAAAAMNAGWLFWCLYEVGRRIYRRRTYHSGRQRAV